VQGGSECSFSPRAGSGLSWRTALVADSADDVSRARGTATRMKPGSFPVRRVFPATILGASNHHTMNLRGSERVLEGRRFRGNSTPELQMSF
jgi:hypothetical protein